LSGRLYDLMFENPDVSAAKNLPEAPYYSRLPFVATVGLGAAEPGFPATPLSLGSLDLASADARLTPGRLQPTLYAEIKRLPGAIVMNQLYQAAAQAPGRFAPLRNNRTQADPLLLQSNTASSQSRAAPRQLAIAIAGHAPSVTVGQSSVGPSQVPPSSGPVMIVYHGYYPVDDVARRRPTIGATDREFHHLATALLLFSEADEDNVAHRRRQAVAVQPRGFVFTCTGPDLVRMMPLDHPFLTKLNNQGDVDPDGSHVVVYAVIGSPTGWQYADQPSDANANIIQDSVAKSAPWGGRLLGGLTFIAVGAGIGAVAGPIGALIGAAVALVVYVLISIICFLFGCGSGDNNQFQQSPAFDPQPSGNSFTQSATNDLAPAGVSQSSGGAKPARTFDLQMIPHFYDRNLYGLLGGGNGTLQVVDNSADQEMLAWHSFPLGIGYQFDRKVPGAIDISGSSIRNYFDLFTRKFEEVSQAQAAVTYFA
jgi:hypothetical protein